MNFYKRYIGDYQRDTGDIPLLEHGVYTLLLDAYYGQSGPLRDNTKALRRLCRSESRRENVAILSVLRRFFVHSEDGYWHHKRADLEIEKAKARAAQNKANGQLGGRPTLELEITEPDTQSVSEQKPNGKPIHSHSHSHSKNKQQKITDVPPVAFLAESTNGHRPPQSKPVTKYPQFPTADSRRLTEAWLLKRGPVGGLIRQAFAECYPVDGPPLYAIDDMVAAVKFYNEAAICHRSEVQWWTPKRLVAELPTWIKIARDGWFDEDKNPRPMYLELLALP